MGDPRHATGVQVREQAATGDTYTVDRRAVITGALRVFLPLVVGFVLLANAIELDATPQDVTKGSGALAPGQVLATVDSDVESRDHTLQFPADTRETRMLIWDYAAEDGDWVQVRVNGTPLGEPFLIQHAPREVVVPVGAVVEVVGVRDGVGGITYAVNFPALKTSITNGNSVGTGNRYTLDHVQPGGGAK